MQLGDVDGVLSHEGDVAVLVEEGQVGARPVLHPEAAIGRGDGIGRQGKGLGYAGLQHPAQRLLDLPPAFARGRERLEDIAPDDLLAGPLRAGAIGGIGFDVDEVAVQDHVLTRHGFKELREIRTRLGAAGDPGFARFRDFSIQW